MEHIKNEKRGRKLKTNPKNRQYRLRLNQEEYEKIEFLAIQKEMTMADILRKGVNMMYELERSKF